MKNGKDYTYQCTKQQNASTFQPPNADIAEEEGHEIESLQDLLDTIP